MTGPFLNSCGANTSQHETVTLNRTGHLCTDNSSTVAGNVITGEHIVQPIMIKVVHILRKLYDLL